MSGSGDVIKEDVPLLQIVQDCVGSDQYDPILLLVLNMPDDVLKQQTQFGESLLASLQPLLGRRLEIIEAAKAYVQDVLHQELEWRLTSQHMPSVQYKSRKNELLHQDWNETNNKQPMCPTLLQIVYRYTCSGTSLYNMHVLILNLCVCVSRSGARRHCLAPKWTDALHVEMLELLLNEDELPMRLKGKSDRRAMQVIEFPNDIQRIHKLYVDWDKKLSETGLLVGQEDALVGHVGIAVEKVRQCALTTPAAVLRILNSLGSDKFELGGQGGVQVLVKEGTRKTGTSDWKISFHFVFQV